VKIAFVALNYAPSRGGAQELVQHLAEGLVGRGHQVQVLTTDGLRSPGAPDRGRIDPADEVIGGVRVRRFAIPAPISSGLRAVRMLVHAVRRRSGRTATDVSPWLDGPWSPGLLRAVRAATRTDAVVVGCSGPFATVLAPTWFRRGASARLVAMPLLHVPASEVHPAVRRALRRSDRVVALTSFERDTDVQLGVDGADVAVIPAGTDPSAFPALSPAEARRRVGLVERPTVGFVGRLAAYKGIDTFLDAARLVWAAQPDTTILLAGSPTGWGGYRDPELAALAGDRLVIRESFPAEERAVLLAACDVVVHPSRAESFGLVTIEAWAARRPIVVGDIPAVRSLVGSVPAALLVDPGDDEELARTLIELLADLERCQELGAVGRAEVEERFTWDRVGAAWDELLAGLAMAGTA
jgi:glycosyltransferase involved in cell wall biosynthesis